MNQLRKKVGLAAWVFLLAGATSALCAWGCGSSEDTDGSGASGGAGGGTGGAGAVGGGGSGGALFDSGTGGSGAGQGGTGVADACAAQTATGELRPVYLAFAFDASGSMGELDYPWHDPELKWNPVVAATESFFADPASAGISASMVFFPALSDRCLSSSYVDPDVPMTALPSTAFADALAGVTPDRGGTPTLAVLQGTFEFLEGIVDDDPDGLYAVVLVTDGYPQGCDDNDIPTVVELVSEHASTIPTYVIGVENPPLPDAPDTVSDLNAIAVAGGTSQAFLIATGDPESTKESFSQAIDEIRGQAVSCEIAIPPAPAGQVFDRSKVTVLYSSGGDEAAFVYDPDCEQENAWHYDDPDDPKTIVLCPSTCEMVMADPQASILVEFGCEDVIEIK